MQIIKRLGRMIVRLLDDYEDEILPDRKVDLPAGHTVCPSCRGNGGWSANEMGSWVICPTCKGYGTIPK